MDRDEPVAGSFSGGSLVVGAADRKNPYTQRAIERAIRAAVAAGLRVIGVQPNGTVLTEARENPTSGNQAALTSKPPLRDAREKRGAH
jgi:hypothetical protein